MREFAVAVLFASVATACGPGPAEDRPLGNAIITADTVDPALRSPGTVFSFGPALPEVIEGPVYPPVVEGDEGQVSIYDGYFVTLPCAGPPAVDASLAGDTITVRIVSEPDTLRPDPCQETPRPLGYAVLVGQFEPGDYAVRLVHEGDAARPAPLDTVYEGITVRPR